MQRLRPKERAGARRARSELYRQLIVEGAEQVFAEKRFEDAKMEEIARESGLSLGTVYSVFAGKAQIRAAVTESRTREILAFALENLRHPAQDPFENLLDGMRGTVGYFMEHPHFLRMHLLEGRPWAFQGPERGSARRLKNWRQGIEMLGEGFQRSIDAGRVRNGDPRLMARLASGAMHVLLAAWVEEGMRREVREVADDLADHVRRAFAREPRATRK